MKILLIINDEQVDVGSGDKLRDILRKYETTQFREIWLRVPGGPSLAALMNRDMGWLMYLRESGDAGFSSRNPDFAGGDKTVIEYKLANGQLDEYPANWALGENDVLKALEHFLECRSRPTFITWYDDCLGEQC
jgi:Immunity protein Imm1